MLWVIEISKIFEKKTENTNKTEKIYKNVRIILRLHAKQDKIYCIQENNRGYIMEKIYETAYAKINLGLDVLGKRSDGYHEVRMVMQSVGLSDAVEIEEGEGLVVETDHSGLAGGPDNLAWKAAELLAEKLKATGVKVAFTDLCRDDMAEAVEDAFRYDRLVLCACTYDGGIFPPMEDFLHHLKAKAYQNRKIAFVENGSWAPTAARQMKAIVEGFKNIECVEPVVTIKSTLNEASEKQMDELVAALTR